VNRQGSLGLTRDHKRIWQWHRFRPVRKLRFGILALLRTLGPHFEDAIEDRTALFLVPLVGSNAQPPLRNRGGRRRPSPIESQPPAPDRSLWPIPQNYANSAPPGLSGWSGSVSNLCLGCALPNYRLEFVGMAALFLVLVLGPPCVFIPKLNAARLAGLRTHGRLASDYVVGFAGKWTRGAITCGEPLLGLVHIQFLADLANSFAIVKEMKLVPFGKDRLYES
jgi:hypothetical protein